MPFIAVPLSVGPGPRFNAHLSSARFLAFQDQVVGHATRKHTWVMAWR